MRRSNIAILITAIVMGGIAAALARSWALSHTRNSEQGKIVVAAAPLAFGATISEDKLVELPWAASTLPEGAFATKHDLLKDGRRVVLTPLERNEPILRSKITAPGQRGSLSSLLGEGKRAVTVRVDDVRGVAGFILPNDRVDAVLLRNEEGTQKPDGYSDILLHDVKVLAIDQLANERQETPTVAKAVSLEVSTHDAQKVLLATNTGKLFLILRQAGQGNPEPTRRFRQKDLSRREVVSRADSALVFPDDVEFTKRTGLLRAVIRQPECGVATRTERRTVQGPCHRLTVGLKLSRAHRDAHGNHWPGHRRLWQEPSVP